MKRAFKVEAPLHVAAAGTTPLDLAFDRRSSAPSNPSYADWAATTNLLKLLCGVRTYIGPENKEPEWPNDLCSDSSDAICFRNACSDVFGGTVSQHYFCLVGSYSISSSTK